MGISIVVSQLLELLDEHNHGPTLLLCRPGIAAKLSAATRPGQIVAIPPAKRVHRGNALVLDPQRPPFGPHSLRAVVIWLPLSKQPLDSIVDSWVDQIAPDGQLIVVGPMRASLIQWLRLSPPPRPLTDYTTTFLRCHLHGIAQFWPDRRHVITRGFAGPSLSCQGEAQRPSADCETRTGHFRPGTS